MFLWIDFVLATSAIVTLVICYVLILAKLKPSDEASENLASPLIPQENNEDMSKQRRIEMLEKIKEEKIKEYYDRKKRKISDS
ncbi:MAG: hypothetical protein ACETVM_04205 [Candidatus Bathyarchaeia archaeon]